MSVRKRRDSGHALALLLLAVVTIASQGQQVHAQVAQVPAVPVPEVRPVAPPQAARHLRFAAPNFPPYYGQDAQGSLTGSLFDLWGLLAVEAGFAWSGTVAPAARMVQDLTSRRADATILVANPTLIANDFIQSDRPVTALVLNVVRRAATPPVANRDALKGKSVAMIRGFAYGGTRVFLEGEGQARADATQITDLDSEHGVVRFLEAGRAEYGLLYDVNYAAAVRTLGRQPEGLVLDSISRVPGYLFVSKTTVKDAESAMARLMAAYDRLVASGAIASLRTGS